MSGSWDGCVTLSLGLVAEIRAYGRADVLDRSADVQGRHVGIYMQNLVLQEMRVFCSTRFF